MSVMWLRVSSVGAQGDDRIVLIRCEAAVAVSDQEQIADVVQVKRPVFDAQMKKAG